MPNETTITPAEAREHVTRLTHDHQCDGCAGGLVCDALFMAGVVESLAAQVEATRRFRRVDVLGLVGLLLFGIALSVVASTAGRDGVREEVLRCLRAADAESAAAACPDWMEARR